jgi:Tol biopolymer transport system component
MTRGIGALAVLGLAAVAMLAAAQAHGSRAATVAYVAIGAKRADVAVIGADGSGRRQLTRSPKNDYAICPAWSPSGNAIAAVEQQQATSPVTGGSWLEALAPNGQRLWRVAGEAACPSWSPDGKHLAFFESLRSGKLGLSVVDPSGRNKRRLVTGVDGRMEPGVPAWSPDSNEIAYYRPSESDSGDFLIQRVRLDGSADTPIHVKRSAGFCSDYCQLYAAWMTWAPAKSIAFLLAGGDLAPEVLYAIDPDGTNQRLLSGQLQDVYVPAWAPDGSRIAFIARRGRNDQIWVAGADGSGVRQLGKIVSPASNLSGVFDPVWSPDGKQLAVWGHKDGVYLVDAASGKARLLVGKATGPVSWHP